jgi:predicted amidohydrolase
MRFTLAALPTRIVLNPAGPAIAANAAFAAAQVRLLCLDDPSVKIVVLPLFLFTGGRGNAGTLDADAPPLQPLIAAARASGVMIAGADRFATGVSGFLIGMDGALALTQGAITGDTRPAELGVIDTAYGRIACLVGEDAGYAEYARLAMFKGAEILLNPTAEIADQRTEARHCLRGSRAWENLAVLAAAGPSEIVDDQNRTVDALLPAPVAEIWGQGGDLLAGAARGPARAVVDLAALRRRRRDPWINFPAQLRTELYAGFYERAAATPRVFRETEGPVYEVLMMQAHQTFVTDLDTREAVIRSNLDRALSLAAIFAQKPALKLLVLPEFGLQGSFPGPLAEYDKRLIRADGPETARLADFARQFQTYVCAAILEYDPEWPLRFFNTALIFAPSGERILRYRKIQCADVNGLLSVCTPGNVYSEYVRRYGQDGLVPTVETEIGTLGTAICYDNNWPELYRAMALKGVEVVAYPTSEIQSDRMPGWQMAKRAHAAENMLYIASANAGSEQFAADAPVTAMNRGRSCLVDFNGRYAAIAEGAGTIPLVGTIDLGALRRARANPAENHLGRFRPGEVTKPYRDYPGFPLDCFAEKPMENPREGLALTQAQIARLERQGIYRAA